MCGLDVGLSARDLAYTGDIRSKPEELTVALHLELSYRP